MKKTYRYTNKENEKKNLNTLAFEDVPTIKVRKKHLTKDK